MAINTKLGAALFCASSLAMATPQLISTDSLLFDELNGLVNRQVIQLDLSTFPLSQSEVKRALKNANPQNQSDRLVIQRINETLKEKRDGFTLEVETHSQLGQLNSSNVNRKISPFGVQDQHRTTAKQSFGAGDFDFFLQANYRSGKTAYRSRQWDFAGSYTAFRIANQWLSVGMQDRFWGVGHSGSLILGDTAKPIAAISLQRDKQDPFETKWLSWIGRWQYQIFVGQPMNWEGMQSPQNSKLIGMRLTAQPTHYLDIGFSRVIQWGGKGRDQSARSLINALLGKDNAGDNVAIDAELSNQIAGVDFRVRLMPLLNMPISIYGQVVGESKSKYLPTQNFYLFGIDGSHNISHRQTLNWFVEGVDTSIDFGRRTHTAYVHHIYQDGYYHQKLPMGYGWGNDVRMFVLGTRTHYRNNDITALVKNHHWHTKLMIGKSMRENINNRYQAIELGWKGDIPINKYISLKLGTSFWLMKENNATNPQKQSGVSLNASLEF